MSGGAGLAGYRARLLARLEELRALAESTREDRRPVELDPGRQGRLSRADALERQAIAQEGEHRRQREIARIESALARMAEGEYGWCAVCGEEIAAARLELDPATPVCVDCAARQG
ncbi:MAG TPA: TraR/DksA family transcriptional regulator [Rhodospirillales bacterium]|nr:TraR/DksA family transcriptional regulator [Rhodospirillales bacterium]